MQRIKQTFASSERQKHFFRKKQIFHKVNSFNMTICQVIHTIMHQVFIFFCNIEIYVVFYIWIFVT